MCMPKPPKPVSVPERQAAQMPERDARSRTEEISRRRRGYTALIRANDSALGVPSTTNKLGI